MEQIVKDVLASPVALAIIIALVVLVLVPPLSLRLAGLTGEQIRQVLESTWQHFIELVATLRAQNKQP